MSAGPGSRPVTSISFFRFRGFWAKFWAFRQMGTVHGSFRRLPDIGFFKVLGSGRGVGFDWAPDFGTYAVLATWPTLEAAKNAVGASEGPFAAYRQRSVESWTVFLAATRAHGSWDGTAPFDTVVRTRPEAPLGVLTRASIHPWRLIAFWRSVPAVSGMTVGRPPLRFSIGMGDRPLSQLTTFSIWDDAASMKQFAYGTGHHRTTMTLARRDGWFTEDLFARFEVLGALGSWGGADPLAGLAVAGG